MRDAQENKVDLDDLVERYSPLVKKSAKMITFNNDEYEDAVQDGYVGLLQAVEKYDPTKGNFGSFAKVWIRGAILKGLRGDRTVHLPDSEYNRRKKAKEVIKEDKASFEDLKDKGEEVPAAQKAPDEIVSEKQIMEIIQDEIQKMPPKEKLVMTLRLDEVTLKEIGKNHLDVTVPRVYQIYSDALIKIQKRFE
jgi:RNA polymerase sigma factor (sigma-70 family)